MNSILFFEIHLNHNLNKKKTYKISNIKNMIKLRYF